MEAQNVNQLLKYFSNEKKSPNNMEAQNVSQLLKYFNDKNEQFEIDH